MLSRVCLPTVVVTHGVVMEVLSTPKVSTSQPQEFAQVSREDALHVY